MAMDTATVMLAFGFGTFFYLFLWRSNQSIFKMIGALGFAITFGTLLMSAETNTHYAISIMGILFSLGLMFIAFITPDSKAKKGRIF